MVGWESIAQGARACVAPFFPQNSNLKVKKHLGMKKNDQNAGQKEAAISHKWVCRFAGDFSRKALHPICRRTYFQRIEVDGPRECLQQVLLTPVEHHPNAGPFPPLMFLVVSLKTSFSHWVLETVANCSWAS